MTQTELIFRSQGGATSQNARLAEYFHNNPGLEIPMPALATVITPTGIGAAVHSRVADLRKQGMRITHRNKRVGGQVHSYYTYEPD